MSIERFLVDFAEKAIRSGSLEQPCIYGRNLPSAGRRGVVRYSSLDARCAACIARMPPLPQAISDARFQLDDLPKYFLNYRLKERSISI